MKKFLSSILTAAIILLFTSVPSLAAQRAEFKITLTQQSDKAVTVTFDFVSGTGFSALDFEIKYNDVKLTLNECEYGDGYNAFSNYLRQNGSSCISNINDKSNPVKVAMALLEPFKIVSGGSLVKMSFSKIPGTKLSDNDITVEITNCQTSDFKDISVSVTSSLASSGSSGGGSTQYPQMTSVDGTVGGDENSQTGEKTKESGSASQQQAQSDALNSTQDISSQSQTAADDSDGQGTASSNIKTAVIIAAAVLCLAGVGAVIVVYIRNKNRKDG